MSLERQGKPEPTRAPGEVGQLAPGDLVKVKSGGPVLTVSRPEPPDCVVLWMTKEGDLRTGRIPIACLERAR